VLFLYRYILGKDTGDLSGTVRAKRGQRLPFVLTVEEVRLLFNQMSGLKVATRSRISSFLFLSGGSSKVIPLT
jgi:hypothetical protein